MMCIQLGVVTLLSCFAALTLEPQQWLWDHIWVFFPWLIFLAISEGLGFTLMAVGQVSDSDSDNDSDSDSDSDSDGGSGSDRDSGSNRDSDSDTVVGQVRTDASTHRRPEAQISRRKAEEDAEAVIGVGHRCM
jgi:hypothetical protein